ETPPYAANFLACYFILAALLWPIRARSKLKRYPRLMQTSNTPPITHLSASPPFDHSGKLTAYLRPNQAEDKLEYFFDLHWPDNTNNAKACDACEYGKVLAGPHHVIAAQGRRRLTLARDGPNDRSLLAVLNVASHELVECQLGPQHQQVVETAFLFIEGGGPG
ncbi:hypothetical protein THAOC_05750, partial [Thalassiosira oceanica]